MSGWDLPHRSKWIVLHEQNPYHLYSAGIPMDEREWREITVQVNTIFAVGPAPSGWAEGAVVYSTGQTYLQVRESRDVVVAMCGGNP